MKYFFLILLLLPLSAAAQTDNAGEPVEITAKRTLEWHRNDKKYIAVGDVVAKQGTATVYADTLTADYRETAGSNMDIYQLTAEGNVRLENNDGSTGYGDKAIYTVDDAKAVLTGGDLKIVSPERTITARDRMEYYTQKGEASAIGNAKLIEGDDTITADTLTSYFTQDAATGKRSMSRAEAHNNVVITTPKEKITGDKGVYTASNNTAEVTGTVRVTSGQNILEGARASVNLTTNVSTMYGGKTSPTGDNRVRGVFYPDKKKEAPQSAQ